MRTTVLLKAISFVLVLAWLIAVGGPHETGALDRAAVAAAIGSDAANPSVWGARDPSPVGADAGTAQSAVEAGAASSVAAGAWGAAPEGSPAADWRRAAQASRELCLRNEASSAQPVASRIPEIPSTFASFSKRGDEEDRENSDNEEDNENEEGDGDEEAEEESTAVSLDRISVRLPGAWERVVDEDEMILLGNKSLANEPVVLFIGGMRHTGLRTLDDVLMSGVEGFEADLGGEVLHSWDEPTRGQIPAMQLPFAAIMRVVRLSEDDVRIMLSAVFSVGAHVQFVTLQCSSEAALESAVAPTFEAFDDAEISLPSPTGDPVQEPRTHKRFAWQLSIPGTWRDVDHRTRGRQPYNVVHWDTTIQVPRIMNPEEHTTDDLRITGTWLASIPDDYVYALYRSIWPSGSRRRPANLRVLDAQLDDGTVLVYLAVDRYRVNRHGELSSWQSYRCALMLVHPGMGTFILHGHVDPRSFRRSYSEELDRVLKEEMWPAALSLRWLADDLTESAEAVSWLEEKKTFSYSWEWIRHFGQGSTIVSYRNRRWKFHPEGQLEIELDDGNTFGNFSNQRYGYDYRGVYGLYNFRSSMSWGFDEIPEGRSRYRVFKDTKADDWLWLYAYHADGATTLHTLRIGESFAIDGLRDGAVIRDH